MKKLIALASIILIGIGCNKEDAQLNDDQQRVVHFSAMRNCETMHVLERQLKEDPSLADRMAQIEKLTETALTQGRLVNGVIEIPVHVNVIYNTAAQNISNAQIQSQIDVLNEDFGAYNPDYSLIPQLFQGVKSDDIKIRFVWDPATGTSRVSSRTKSWRTNDDMKRSNKGGISPTDCANKLNIWVCVLSNNILGYAQFPGGNCATDGIVVHTNAFGRGNYNLFTAFNKGRTATHEIGHWLNLRHIWGDATCGNDFVADTPVHNSSNTGCPVFPRNSTCTGTPVMMTMNYMDYTNDACMYMFTMGQKSRMLATFSNGGPRNAFAQP
jgi:hypothetical protein